MSPVRRATVAGRVSVARRLGIREWRVRHRHSPDTRDPSYSAPPTSLAQDGALTETRERSNKTPCAVQSTHPVRRTLPLMAVLPESPLIQRAPCSSDLFELRQFGNKNRER